VPSSGGFPNWRPNGTKGLGIEMRPLCYRCAAAKWRQSQGLGCTISPYTLSNLAHSVFILADCIPECVSLHSLISGLLRGVCWQIYRTLRRVASRRRRRRLFAPAFLTAKQLCRGRDEVFKLFARFKRGANSFFLTAALHARSRPLGSGLGLCAIPVWHRQL